MDRADGCFWHLTDAETQADFTRFGSFADAGNPFWNGRFVQLCGHPASRLLTLRRVPDWRGVGPLLMAERYALGHCYAEELGVMSLPGWSWDF
mgnify:CR=1 FL=1